MFKRVETAERVQFSVMHPKVAGKIIGARQVHSAVVTELAVVVLKGVGHGVRKKLRLFTNDCVRKAYQQIGGFAGDAIVVEIVGWMHRMVVVRGRTVGRAVFENVRHRGGLRSTG